MDIVLACVTSAGFIGLVYAWPVEFNFIRRVIFDLKSAALDDAIFVERNSIGTIYRRIISFSIAVFFSAVYLLFLPDKCDTALPSLCTMCSSTLVTAFTPFSSASTVLRCLSSTCLLFIGPLIERYFDCRPLLQTGNSLIIDLRSYIISPLVEELFFRGVLFRILHKRSALTQIIISAAIFSLAHGHHVFYSTASAYREITRRSAAHGKMLRNRCWLIGLQETAMVCAFSFLFGIVGGYYFQFVAKRSILCTTISHGLCNLFGPPDFTFLQKNNRGMAYHITFAVIYLLGVVLFFTSASFRWQL